MVRSFILAYWEIQRVRRSGPALLVVLIAPVGFATACILLGSEQAGGFLSRFFPLVAVFAAWGLFSARSAFDRVSGFAGGIRSTPAAGGVAFAARLLAGLFFALVQSGIFYGVVRLAARL